MQDLAQEGDSVGYIFVFAFAVLTGVNVAIGADSYQLGTAAFLAVTLLGAQLASIDERLRK